MPHKNWQTICKVDDPNFRLLLATTKDPYILAGLEKGFPDLFSEGETPLQVPASALQKAAEEWSREEYQSDEYVEFDRELCWVNILDRFNIPIIFDGAAADSGLRRANAGIPEGVIAQLVGERFEMGMTVQYRNVRCLVIDIGFKHDTPRLHALITERPQLEWIRLIPADCVDLHS